MGKDIIVVENKTMEISRALQQLKIKVKIGYDSSSKYGVVLIDADMPNFLELLEKTKKLGKIIAVIGSKNDDCDGIRRVKEIMSLGVCDLLRKPINPELLFASIEKIIGTRKKGKPKAIKCPFIQISGKKPDLFEEDLTLKELERQYIAYKLEQHGGKIATVAKLLGIESSTLKKRLKVYLNNK